MSVPQLTSVPWPRILIGRDGTLAASRAALELLEFALADVRDLRRRLEVLRPTEGTDGEQACAWDRAARGEQFDDMEVWRDRESERLLRVRVRAYSTEGWGSRMGCSAWCSISSMAAFSV